MSRLRRLVLLLGSVGLLAGCSAEVDVDSATVSQDDLRLRLTLQTCNPTWVDTRVVDVGHRIEVSVSAKPAGLLGGDDCLHSVIVALPAPLAGRDVFDTSSRSRGLVPVELSSQPWPYDRERFTMADYEAALAAMVACLEAGDPLIDAEIVDDLDWPAYDWHIRRDDRGNFPSLPLFECIDEHLAPLGGNV